MTNDTTVIKTTAIRLDVDEYPNYEAEIVSKEELRSRQQRIRTVVYGTFELYDLKSHNGLFFENISKHEYRKHTCEYKVAGSTGEKYDPKIHVNVDPQIVPHDEYLRRKKKTVVVKGTITPFDFEKHQDLQPETIGKCEHHRRTNGKIVLKNTSILYDINIHQGAEIQAITNPQYHRREKGFNVVKGTAITYDYDKHKHIEVENITAYQYKNRSELFFVIKGTTELYDPQKHKNAEIEALDIFSYRDQLQKAQNISERSTERHHTVISAQNDPATTVAPLQDVAVTTGFSADNTVPIRTHDTVTGETLAGRDIHSDAQYPTSTSGRNAILSDQNIHIDIPDRVVITPAIPGFDNMLRDYITRSQHAEQQEPSTSLEPAEPAAPGFRNRLRAYITQYQQEDLQGTSSKRDKPDSFEEQEKERPRSRLHLP